MSTRRRPDSYVFTRFLVALALVLVPLLVSIPLASPRLLAAGATAPVNPVLTDSNGAIVSPTNFFAGSGTATTSNVAVAQSNAESYASNAAAAAQSNAEAASDPLGSATNAATIAQTNAEFYASNAAAAAQTNAEAASVPTARTVNGHALSADVSVAVGDLSGIDAEVARVAALAPNGSGGLFLEDGGDGSYLQLSSNSTVTNASHAYTADLADAYYGLVEYSQLDGLNSSNFNPLSWGANTMNGFVTLGYADARYAPITGSTNYVQTALSVSAPAPTVTSGGTYPEAVWLLPGSVTFSSLGMYNGAGLASNNFFTGTFMVGVTSNHAPSQSVKIISLPFAPTDQISWHNLLMSTVAAESNPTGQIRVYYADSGGESSPTSYPYGCCNGKSAVAAGDPFFTLTFGTANITCAAGDTLTLCTSVVGTTPTGGSLFTFTANAAVTSSATVDIGQITSVVSSDVPTISDTVVYDVTSNTSFTTTYSKNSATNTSSWPRNVLFPSHNGSNWDINIFNRYEDTLSFVLTVK